MQVTTDKQLFDEVRKLGLTIRKYDGEYRVNLKGGDEGTANYTSDRQDAYQTALAMAKCNQHAAQHEFLPDMGNYGKCLSCGQAKNAAAHTSSRSDRSMVYAVRILLEKHKHELEDTTLGQISDAYHVLGILARKLEER
jgi:hypothetical protein